MTCGCICTVCKRE